jgi:acyl-coenzyme A synthetase/AMP-(fatty) acid ligase
VIGVPDDTLGQAIHAFLVLAAGVTLTERQVQKRCMEKMESFMVPTRIFFLDELPKSANGKIDKQTLMQWNEKIPEKKIKIKEPQPCSEIA